MSVPSSLHQRTNGKANFERNGCGFCKRNKEPESIYMNHQLKDSQGQVSCPQLYKYRCELCGATGPEAHTRSYCPMAGDLRRITRPSRLIEQVDPINYRPSSVETSPRQDTTIAQLNLSGALSQFSGATMLRTSGRQQQIHPNSDRNNNLNNNNGTHLQVSDMADGRGSSSIQVSNVRLFRNMGLVSNSRYNSAGVRRDLSRRH